MFGIETIEKYIEDKICDYGASVIMGAIAESPLGRGLEAMNRASEFLESGGLSELDRIAAGEIKQLTAPLRFRFTGKELLNKLLGAVQETPRRGPHGGWQQSGWATSQEDWITNRWKHDWRSQPREPAGSSRQVLSHHGSRSFWRGAGGDWIKGRLQTPAIATHAMSIGKGKARSSRQKRRMQRYRRYGRLAARSARMNDGD